MWKQNCVICGIEMITLRPRKTCPDHKSMLGRFNTIKRLGSMDKKVIYCVECGFFVVVQGKFRKHCEIHSRQNNENKKRSIEWYDKHAKTPKEEREIARKEREYIKFNYESIMERR